MQSTIINFTFCTARLEHFVDLGTSLLRLDLVAHVGADAHTVEKGCLVGEPPCEFVRSGKATSRAFSGGWRPSSPNSNRRTPVRETQTRQIRCWLQEEGCRVRPFVLNLTGGWGGSTKTFLKWLREEVERKTPGTAGALLGLHEGCCFKLSTPEGGGGLATG